MKKQNFLKGSLILMASAVLAKLLGALFKIPLTNILGGVGMSYFSCAYSLFMPIYALTVTGLSAAVARMTAQSAALGMYENAKRVRRTALALFSAAGLAGSVLILLLAKPFCVYAVDCSEAAAAVAMIAPSVFFGCVTSVERGYYEGLSNMYPTALSQLAEGLVKVAAGLSLCSFVTENAEAVMEKFPCITDIRALAAAAGILGVTLSSAGAALFFAVVRIFDRKRFHEGEGTLMGHREISRELVSTALPTGVSAVVTNLTGLIDMGTMIGCISCFGCGFAPPSGVSEEELPHFVYGSFAGIALTVFNLVPSVTNMLGKGILPSVTEAWENHDVKALSQRAMQALLTAAVIAAPAACGMAALSGEVLHFLFPKQSDEVEICINSLRLLMPGMVCLCLSFPIFSMLQAIGKPSSPLKIMLLGAAVKLVGNLALIPIMGADGAALSTSVCYGLILAVSLRLLLKKTGIRLRIKPFGAVAYSGAMCGGSAYFVSDILEMRGFGEVFTLFCAVAAGGAVYLASAYAMRDTLGFGSQTVRISKNTI
ncbi:MAG: polysaccharide biosynthesis C-terminal domain-containing protein [Ruminococcus sp.]|nr:polysaccharide biosynthesis C-terminal domain-containing protein [Ruminococcus sp.]